MTAVQQEPCPEHVVKAIQHIAAGGPFYMVLAEALKERAIAEGYDAKAIVIDDAAHEGGASVRATK